MAAVNRCQGFYWLRIYHLTDGAICAPPQANLSYEMNFDIGFMLENIHNPKCSSVTLEDSAKNFRAMAQSIIKILPESINHSQESNGDKFDIMSVLHAASGFLEAADYLDRLADERRN